ncbi:MAG: carboxymuconolactone decarboxylase family protein [Bauldia sp.]
MARVPYITRDEAPAEYRELFDHSASNRGHVSHLFRALVASPKLFRKRYDYSNSLRDDTAIDRRYRELAVLTVGRIANSEYEFTHHARLALLAGVRPTQIDALADFETSTEFNEQDKAVMRYAVEVTEQIHVSDQTWAALAKFFNHRQLVELVLIVAWYNQTVRVLIPLQIELEADTVNRYVAERERHGAD